MQPITLLCKKTGVLFNATFGVPELLLAKIREEIQCGTAKLETELRVEAKARGKEGGQREDKN